MSGLEEWLDPVLTDAVSALVQEHSSNLRSVVRFGSTTEFIKYDTDVDMLLIFEKLPHRRERHELLASWERETNERLGALSRLGFNLSLSVLPRTLEEARWWSKIYLDMVEHSTVYFDRMSDFKRIRRRMAEWIKTNQATKKPVHGLPVWTYPLENTHVDLFEEQ